MAPLDRANSAAVQQHLLDLLPSNDVLLMSEEHWKGLYSSELACLAVDASVLGGSQVNVSREHRSHVAAWMSEACSALGWTAQTFYVSVHALDRYITTVSHVILPQDLGPIATACLYFGAQLVESATEENVYTLEKFRTLCPEIGTSESVREAQAHLLDTLQGLSLCRKTPFDFFSLFLAQMAVSQNEPIKQLFQLLLKQNGLERMFDACSGAGLCFFTSGLCLDMPGSYLMASVVFNELTCVFPQLERLPVFQHVLCEEVLHFPGGLENLRPFLELTSDFLSNACRRPSSKTPVSARQTWCKHIHPSSFADWPMGAPSAELTQLGRRLRTTLAYDGGAKDATSKTKTITTQSRNLSVDS